MSSCPIFRVNKLETNSPRGYLSIIDFWMKKHVNGNFSEKIFQCLLCGKCVLSCPLKINIPELILRVREELVRNSEAPSFVKDLREKFRMNGNVLGEPVKPIVNKLSKTLLFKGCVYSVDLKSLNRARRLLSLTGLNFTELKKEYCCGLILKSLGLINEFKTSIEKNTLGIKEVGVEEIVTLCPACWKAIRENYSSLSEKIRVLSICEFLLESVKEKSLPLSGLDIEIVYLKDSSEDEKTCLDLLSKIPKLRVKEVVEVFSCHMINECNRGLVEESYLKQVSELVSRGCTVFISSSPMSTVVLRSLFRGKPLVFDSITSLMLTSLIFEELISKYL